MKQNLLMLCALIMFCVVGNAQTIMFEPFETHPDSNYISVYAGVNDTSQVALSVETSIVNQGAAALRMDWRAERAADWGGFCKYEIWADSNEVWNFSAFENVSFWYYNDSPSSDPGRVHFRYQLFDVSDAPINSYDAGQTELWYSFEYILDDTPGWNQVILPLEDVGSAATGGSNGFWRTGWSGIAGNDYLDLNQVKGIGLEFSIDGPLTNEIHTGSIILDALGFEGARALPVVFFNGKVIPGNINNHFAWNGATSVVPDAGFDPVTPALKWEQGAGQPWTGFVFEFDPQFLNFRWNIDSLKFKIKAPTGTSTLRAQFGDTHGNLVKTLIDEPGGGYNDQWWEVEIPLRDIVDFETGTSFDTSAVSKFEIMAEGTGNGHTVYFDDMWTGNPMFDIIAPPPPGGLFVVADNQSNLVTWIDSQNEDGETYNVYYSFAPITSLDDPAIEVVEQGIGVPENTGSLQHLLFSPLNPWDLDVYYAVTTVDLAGNESDPAVTASPTNNTARAIGTMQLDPMVSANFAADGNLGEWANVVPITVKPSEGAHIVPNTTVSGDFDLSVDLHMAADNDYFYFAFDIDDDVVDTTAVNSWEKDSPDLFIGLYNGHGAPHTGYNRGDMPDYQFRFLPSRVVAANLGDVPVATASSGDYHWQENPPFGYSVEGRVLWSDLAAIGGDTQFDPVNGKRIPFDLAINDADGGGVREGIMTWSPYNNDNSWQSPVYWMYTWVGDTTVGINENSPIGVPAAFELKQNYPNPFNPSTTIEYSLDKNSKVTLEVFNTLGQKVSTLVKNTQAAGTYSVNFDAANLPSGIYFYRLHTDLKVATHKMILMK